MLAISQWYEERTSRNFWMTSEDANMLATSSFMTKSYISFHLEPFSRLTNQNRKAVGLKNQNQWAERHQNCYGEQHICIWSIVGMKLQIYSGHFTVISLDTLRFDFSGVAALLTANRESHSWRIKFAPERNWIKCGMEVENCNSPQRSRNCLLVRRSRSAWKLFSVSAAGHLISTASSKITEAANVAECNVNYYLQHPHTE